MPKEFEYKKSQFKKHNIVLDKSEISSERFASSKEFSHVIGEDELTEKLSRDLENSTARILETKYGGPATGTVNTDEQIFTIQVTSYDDVSKELDDVHKKIYKGKSISSMTKGKRQKASNEKNDIQQNMLKEQKILIKKRKDERRLFEKTMPKNYITEEGLAKFKEDEISSIREFMTYEDHYGNETLEKYFFKNTADNDTEYDRTMAGHSLYILQQLCGINTRFVGLRFDHTQTHEEIKPESFAYESDAQFVSQFAEKYDKICKMVASEVLFNLYLKHSGTEKNEFPIAQYKAKLSLFRQLKVEYEDRMKLISSPYYVLLAKKDIDSISVDLKDPELQEFKALAKKLEKSPVGKNVNISKLYAKTLDEVAKEQAIQDKANVNNLIGDTPINMKGGEKTIKIGNTTSVVATSPLEDYYERKKAKLAASYPNVDSDFLEHYDAEIHGSLMEGINSAELKAMEGKLLEILNKNTISGVPIKEEHKKVIKEALDEFIKARKDFIASNEAFKDATGLVNACGIDVTNPAFQKTDEYKELKKVYGASADLGTVQVYSTEAKTEYGEKLRDVFSVLYDNGYTISEKYETKIKNEDFVKDCMETARMYAGRRYYSSKKIDYTDDMVEKDFKFESFTINGEKFESYDNDDLSKLLVGRKIVSNNDSTDEFVKTMKQYMEYNRLQAIYLNGLEGNGGEASMLSIVLRKKVNDQIQEIYDKLLELIRKNVDVNVSLDDIAKGVLNGEYGDDEKTKDKITEAGLKAGFDDEMIEARVKELEEKRLENYDADMKKAAKNIHDGVYENDEAFMKEVEEIGKKAKVKDLEFIKEKIMNLL